MSYLLEKRLTIIINIKKIFTKGNNSIVTLIYTYNNVKP